MSSTCKSIKHLQSGDFNRHWCKGNASMFNRSDKKGCESLTLKKWFISLAWLTLPKANSSTSPEANSYKSQLWVVADQVWETHHQYQCCKRLSAVTGTSMMRTVRQQSSGDRTRSGREEISSIWTTATWTLEQDIWKPRSQCFVPSMTLSRHVLTNLVVSFFTPPGGNVEVGSKTPRLLSLKISTLSASVSSWLNSSSFKLGSGSHRSFEITSSQTQRQEIREASSLSRSSTSTSSKYVELGSSSCTVSSTSINDPGRFEIDINYWSGASRRGAFAAWAEASRKSSSPSLREGVGSIAESSKRRGHWNRLSLTANLNQ